MKTLLLSFNLLLLALGTLFGNTICTKATVINCGSIVNGSTTSETNVLASYDCLKKHTLVGPEKVYKLTLTQKRSVNILLNIQASGLDLDLFLLNNVCFSNPAVLLAISTNQCIDASTTNNQSSRFESISQVLDPGTYYIVVDGEFAQSKGNFQLSVSCNDGTICNKATTITCGVPITSSTNTETNALFTYDCLEGYTMVGPDKVYKFTLAQKTTVDIRLSILSAGIDLDLFLLNNVCASTGTVVYKISGTQCVASSISNNQSSNLENISQTLEAGTYYIVVDGQYSTYRGNFQLTLNCNNFCQGAQTITCGQLVSSFLEEGVSNVNDYSCASSSKYFAKERVFKITLNTTTKLQIGLHVPDASYNFDLFLLSSNSDCSQFTCIQKAAVSGIAKSRYILQTLNPGTYYLAVDALFTNTTGSFKIDVACAELNCQNSSILSCKRPTTGNTSSGTNNVSIYGVKQSDNSFKYYPGFIGKEKVYQLEVYEAQYMTLRLRTLNGTTGDLGLFVLKSCNRLDAIASSVNPGGPLSSLNVFLTPGLYYVAVDEYLNANVQFELSLDQTQACANICDYGGRAIYRGTTITGNLTPTELAPSLLYSESCVRAAFGGSLIGKKLYADVYTFYNDVANQEIGLDLTSSSSSNTVAVIFECTQLNAICRIATNEGNLSLDSLQIGYYYIVILSTANPSYNFSIIPNGVCSTNPEVLSVNADPITRSLANAVDNFNIGGGGFNAYVGCYSGSRTYRGRDLEFQFNVETAVKVTITLTANAAMGLFLYDYVCGKGCINYAETNSNGGVTQIEDFTLTPGTYYIVVDKNTLSGDETFSLKVETVEDDENIFFATLDSKVECPQDESNQHNLRLQKTGLNYTANDKLYFLYPGNTAERRLPVSKEVIWDPDQGRTYIPVVLNGDLAGDNLKCSYAENDPISIVLFQRSKGFAEFVVPFYDQTAENPSVNAQGNFKSRGESNIRRFELTKPSHFSPSVAEIIVSSLRDTIVELDFSTSDSFYIETIPRTTWLRVLDPRSAASPYPPQKTRIFISIPKNTTGVAREEVKIVFHSTGRIAFRSEVLVRQRVCTPFEVRFPSPTINTCVGTTVLLSPQPTTGDIADYTFSWQNSRLTDATLLVSRSTAGTQTYTVTVTGGENQCRVEKTAQVVVNFSAPPAAPTPTPATVEVCTNGQAPTLAVSATSNSSFYWYDGPGVNAKLLAENSRTYRPPSIGQAGEYLYYVEARSSTGCVSSRVPIKLLVKATQTIDAQITNSANASLLCAGTALELVAEVKQGASTDYQFAWNTGSTASSTRIPSIAAGLNQYNVTISSKTNSCVSPRTLALEINVEPRPNAPTLPAEPISVCSGSPVAPINLNVPAGISVNWYNNSGQLITQTSSFTPPVPNTPGEYVFFAQASNNRIPGCVSESRPSIKVIVNQNIEITGTIASSTNTTSVCTGTPLQLSAIPNTGSTSDYIFRWETGQTTATIPVNTSAASVQKFTLSISRPGVKCQLNPPITTNVEVKSRPVNPVPLSNLVSTCAGVGLTLAVRAIDGARIDWYNSPSSAANPILSNKIELPISPNVLPGEYLYYAEAVQLTTGCASPNRIPIQLNVTANRTPDVSILSNFSSNQVCAGELVKLDLRANSGTLADYQFLWEDNRTTSPQREFRAERAGTFVYTLKLSGAPGKCFTERSFSYSLTVLPIPSFVGTIPAFSTCLNQKKPELALATSEQAIVDWYNENQQLVKENANPFAPNLGAGEYTFFAQLRSKEGCLNPTRERVKLSVYPALTLAAEMVEKTVSCYGERDGILQLKFNESTNLGSVKYTWADRPELNTARRTGLRAGDYALQVSYGAGCQQDFKVKLNEPDSLQISILKVQADSNGLRTGAVSVAIKGGTAPYEFVWKRNERPFGSTQNLANIPADKYQLEVFDANNCKKTSAVITIRGVSTSTLDHPWASLVQVIPNPSNGHFNLNLDLPEQVDLRAEVWSNLGNRVKVMPMYSLQKGSIEFDLSDQASGMYLLKLSVNTGVIIKRVLVVH
jgi:hypothetical protein